jgi:hypothetical protein
VKEEKEEPLHAIRGGAAVHLVHDHLVRDHLGGEL